MLRVGTRVEIQTILRNVRGPRLSARVPPLAFFYLGVYFVLLYPSIALQPAIDSCRATREMEGATV